MQNKNMKVVCILFMYLYKYFIEQENQKHSAVRKNSHHTQSLTSDTKLLYVYFYKTNLKKKKTKN